MKRRLLAMFLSIMMLCSFGMTVYADTELDTPEDSIIIDRYQYTIQCVNQLTITNRKATCKSSVKGIMGTVTKIELRQTLELSLGSGWWYTIQTWCQTFYNSYNASYSTTRSGLDSGTYRIRSEAKVYSGSNYETIYFYSTPVSC